MNLMFCSQVSPTDLHRFIYKCQTCMLGFKRRGMLVNHLAKRHPTVTPSEVPELNLPILKTTKDFFCQYCDKVYKSSSKRKSHILKNHPGQPLPVGAREVAEAQNKDATTFSQVRRSKLFSSLFSIVFPSQAVGSVTCQSHNCDLCHKQYASKAKLLQHLRKEHRDQAGPSTSTRGERPNKVMYIDSPRSQSPTRVTQENVDDPDHMEPGINLFSNYENEDFMLEARAVQDEESDQFIGEESADINQLTQSLNISEMSPADDQVCATID